MNIWNDLSLSHGQKLGYNEMIGNTDDMIMAETDIPSKTLFIPLQFWFCRNPGLAQRIKPNSTTFMNACAA